MRCSGVGGAWRCASAPAGRNATALTATANPGSTFAGWSGDADCADGAVTMSADRSCTANFAITSGFTEDPIVAGATSVKAVHITELRARINALRAAAGLPAFDWTDATLTASATIVRATHVMELRTALNDAYAAMGRPSPTYTDQSLAGITIKSVHISELRNAVLALE